MSPKPEMMNAGCGPGHEISKAMVAFGLGNIKSERIASAFFLFMENNRHIFFPATAATILHASTQTIYSQGRMKITCEIVA
jgi:hypothetical protein